MGIGLYATVYLARDDRDDRLVALKVLKPELCAVLAVERFLAEIRVTANLHHANLVRCSTAGTLIKKTLYYVTPFIEGENLRKRIDREKQLPVDDAIRIAAAVGGALDYAHRQGAIHRDLRPENILLRDGQVFVVDFGLALAISNASGSRLGLALGTPQYTCARSLPRAIASSMRAPTSIRSPRSLTRCWWASRRTLERRRRRLRRKC